MSKSIYDTIEEYNQMLAKQEAEQSLQMARAWKEIEDKLWRYFDWLVSDVEEAGYKTASEIYQMKRYSDLIEIAQGEIGRFEQFASERISTSQRKAIGLGIDSVRALEDWIGGDISLLDTVVNTVAVQNMIGMCADGSPLFSILSQRAIAPEAIEGLTKALIEGIALGYNPRKTAAAMAEGLAGGLDKALVIARTEQLRAFRESTLEGYRQMGITQYKRHCAFSDRTCTACLGLDGQIYDSYTDFADHPNCRCTMTPVIPGIENSESGAKEWFSELSEDRQLEILGKGRFDLYKNGVGLEEMVTVKNDPTWGHTISVKNLSEMESVE